MKKTLFLAFAYPVAFCSMLGADDPFSEFTGETSLSVGCGYAENVLYSELAPLDAAFAVVSAEGFVERTLFSDALEWSSMLFAERRDFYSDEDIPEQSLALLQSQLGGYAGVFSKWRVGGRYLHLEQAFDVTFDELERNSVLVKASEPELFVGWESFLWVFKYDLELGASRMNFDQEGNDYDAINAEIDLGYRINDEWSWESGFFGYSRDYRDRTGRNLDGAPIAGSRLGMDQVGFETGLAWTPSWDGAQQKFNLMLSDRKREDAQFGYYDRGRQSIEFWWQAEWQAYSLVFHADFSEFRYKHQFADDGELERTDSWSWSLDLERKLAESWALVLGVEQEEEDSNVRFSSYDSQSVFLSLKWLK